MPLQNPHPHPSERLQETGQWTKGQSEKVAERPAMGDGRRGFRSWEELSDTVLLKTSCRKSCSNADKNTCHSASLARSYTAQKSSYRLFETWVKALTASRPVEEKMFRRNKVSVSYFRSLKSDIPDSGPGRVNVWRHQSHLAELFSCFVFLLIAF